MGKGLARDTIQHYGLTTGLYRPLTSLRGGCSSGLGDRNPVEHRGGIPEGGGYESPPSRRAIQPIYVAL